jgi:hypothetical protein
MLEGMTPPKKVLACKVRFVLDSLEPKDQELLKKALADPQWRHTRLTYELNKRGIDISENPVRRHRLGMCSCA